MRARGCGVAGVGLMGLEIRGWRGEAERSFWRGLRGGGREEWGGGAEYLRLT